MNYTLHQLQIFLCISRLQSVTKAADELHLSQPAVSAQLKNFQNQFDIPLTEIIGRKIYITDFGKEIAAAAEKILDEVDAINFKTTSFKGQLSGRLKISVVSTGKYVAPYFISGFLKEHSHVELLMDVTNKKQVLESLEQNEVDFALVSLLPEGLRIEKLELLKNQLYLVGNSDYANFRHQKHDKRIFENLPLIYREAGSGTRDTMEMFIEKNKLPVRKKMELTSNEAVKQAIIAGLGCSIMPLIGIKNELSNGNLNIIPVKGMPLRSAWHLIWLRNKKFSPVSAAFLAYLRQEGQAIAAQHFSWIDAYA